MGGILQLEGQIFGQMTVLGRSHSENGRVLWRCKCACGTERLVGGPDLKRGRVVSCGCHRNARARENGAKCAIDLTGMRFGTRVVIARSGIAAGGNILWLCRCDCGSESVAKASDLRKTGCKVCADAARQIHGHNRKHNRSPAYQSWVGMLTRCTNPNSTKFKDYGGRGITVCDRWLRFENFLADMGERPAGKTIDRFPDNDGPYEPGNCRWATPKEQRANQRHAGGQSNG